VLEFQAVCVERVAAGGIRRIVVVALAVCTAGAQRFVLGFAELDGAVAAIKLVADDRVSDRRHVQANLMISARSRPGANERVFRSACEHLVVRSRGTAITRVRTARHQYAAGLG
jgi:hypothetical protein